MIQHLQVLSDRLLHVLTQQTLIIQFGSTLLPQAESARDAGDRVSRVIISLRGEKIAYLRPPRSFTFGSIS